VARCLGACALAPVLVVNDRVYGNVKPSDCVKILKDYGFKPAPAAK
jgi:NADH:ubiquinone oxidoreductase subunit E